MSRIEYIEVEMYRKMRDSLGLDPVEDRPAAVSKDGWRDMPDAQFLQDQVFIRVPSLHAGDHHTPGVQLAGHFCRESLVARSEEHTSELQSLMRISYAVFCLKKKNTLYSVSN